MLMTRCLNIIAIIQRGGKREKCGGDLKNQTPGGVTDSSFRLKNIMFVCLLLASSHANKCFPYTPAIITFTQQGCHSGTQCHAVIMVCRTD